MNEGTLSLVAFKALRSAVDDQAEALDELRLEADTHYEEVAYLMQQNAILKSQVRAMSGELQRFWLVVGQIREQVAGSAVQPLRDPYTDPDGIDSEAEGERRARQHETQEQP